MKAKKIKTIQIGRKLATAGVLLWVAETIIFSMFFPQSTIERYFDGLSQLLFMGGLILGHFATGEYLEILYNEQKFLINEDEITEEEIRLMAKKIVEDVYGKEPN